MTAVEAVAISRVPPPKGAKVCGNCVSIASLADAVYICTARSVKYRILYLKRGEAEDACDLFDPNILLDLSRIGLEFEGEGDPEPERKD